MWKMDPSVGMETVKEAAWGGAPWRVTWALNWRASDFAGVGELWTWATRMAIAAEIVKDFMVDVQGSAITSLVEGRN